ncbi:MAG TPA: hypothetical protein VLA34_03880 [Candidatus Krumholzibacterium sp.]|nr:hypothetical protein [Candidatus Krumholzibacterium sp.]
MRKGLLLITAMLVVFAMPMSLAAQEKEIEVEVKVCEESCKGELHKCKEESKVDKVTMLKLQKLQIELKMKNLELDKQKSDIMEKMHEEYMSDNPSRKALDKLGAQLFDIEAKLLSNRNDFILEARKFASAEQMMMFHKCCGEKGHGRMGCGGHAGMECCKGHAGMECCKGHGGMSCGKGHAMIGCGKGHGGMKVLHGGKCGSMDHKCGSSCKSDGACKGDGEKRVIMIKCDDAGCGHKDKSECTDECLKKAIKVIEKELEKETDK